MQSLFVIELDLAIKLLSGPHAVVQRVPVNSSINWKNHYLMDKSITHVLDDDQVFDAKHNYC